MIEIRELTEKDIPHVRLLSDSIFRQLLKGLNKSEDKKIWLEYYQKNGLLLGAYEEKILVGFIFFYQKEQGTKTMHCWMDGVDEKYRGQGILTSLMETGQKILKGKGYESLTINTFPEKFPEMYTYLHKYGFNQYKEEEKEWNGSLTKKAFFRKKLGGKVIYS